VRVGRGEDDRKSRDGKARFRRKRAGTRASQEPMTQEEKRRAAVRANDSRDQRAASVAEYGEKYRDGSTPHIEFNDKT